MEESKGSVITHPNPPTLQTLPSSNLQQQAAKNIFFNLNQKPVSQKSSNGQSMSELLDQIRIIWQNDPTKTGLNSEKNFPQTPQPSMNSPFKAPPRPRTPPIHPRKPKRSSSINSFVYESRPTRQLSNNLFSSKSVMTPEWEQEKVVQFNRNSEESHKSQSSKSPRKTTSNESLIVPISRVSEENLSEYDYIAAHRRLETFESRIQYGTDNTYGHPAEAYLAAQANPDYVLTKEESERAEHYEIEPCYDKIPGFWIRRPWDKDDDIMSAENTTKMQQTIADLENPEGPFEEFPEAQNEENKSKKKRRRSGISLNRTKRSMTIVQLPFDSYVTDFDDDVITDWEDI